MEEKKVRSRTTQAQTGARQVRQRSLQQDRKVKKTPDKPASRRRVQSKRRRKRNLMIKAMALVLLVMIAVAGAFFWMKYSPSKEKADLKEYYGIEKDDQVAITIDNEVLEPAGRIIDGVTYLQYEIIRDYINSRFYWDPNENVLLYTLPEGIVSVDVGSKEYSIARSEYSEEYVI